MMGSLATTIAAGQVAMMLTSVVIISDEEAAVYLNFILRALVIAGQDDECLGGWNQHNRYGFAQTEQAYTQEGYVNL